jgi:hypothetical protein
MFGSSIPSKIQNQQSSIGNPMSATALMAHCPSQPNALEDPGSLPHRLAN